MTAQEEKEKADPTYSDNIRHREIMMNTTPLIAQFVPFNASTVSKLNIFDFQIRRLKNGRGTRWGLGINIDGGFNVTELQSFYLRFGFVKRRQISTHVHFYRSWDANFVAEDFENTTLPRKLDFSGFAVSYSAGLEYSFNNRLAISTEGTFFIGLLDFETQSPKIKFFPPVGLLLHVKL